MNSDPIGNTATTRQETKTSDPLDIRDVRPMKQRDIILEVRDSAVKPFQPDLTPRPGIRRMALKAADTASVIANLEARFLGIGTVIG